MSGTEELIIVLLSFIGVELATIAIMLGQVADLLEKHAKQSEEFYKWLRGENNGEEAED